LPTPSRAAAPSPPLRLAKLIGAARVGARSAGGGAVDPGALPGPPSAGAPSGARGRSAGRARLHARESSAAFARRRRSRVRNWARVVALRASGSRRKPAHRWARSHPARPRLHLLVGGRSGGTRPAAMRPGLQALRASGSRRNLRTVGRAHTRPDRDCGWSGTGRSVGTRPAAMRPGLQALRASEIAPETRAPLGALTPGPPRLRLAGYGRSVGTRPARTRRISCGTFIRFSSMADDGQLPVCRAASMD
jgi:hypothetical protein